MNLTFYKYEGTGNDFVMIDNRAKTFPKNNIKTIAKLSYYVLILGWFIFMWLCAYAAHSSTEVRIIVLGLGLLCCLTSVVYLTGIFRNDELFKSIDELNTERNKYRKAVERLNNKIKEL